VTELERDFTFSLTKYPSLIFAFLVVSVSTRKGREEKEGKEKEARMQ